MNIRLEQPNDIEKITLGVLKTGHALVVVPKEKKYNPESIVDAQFSMPFGAAVAVLYGKATLDEYTPDNLRSSKVKKMMARVECKEDPGIEKDFPKKWPASVTIQKKAGKKEDETEILTKSRKSMIQMTKMG